MSYSSEMTHLLAAQLEKFVTLNRHQLAGHAANLDFWMNEVRHCLEVVDGYERRFEQMKAARTQHVSEHKTIVYDLRDPEHTRQQAPPPKPVPTGELGKSRQRLCKAADRFLTRCFNDEMISKTALQRASALLEIDGGR